MDHQRNKGINERSNVPCVVCKQRGHWHFQCRYNRCYWCNMVGHITKNCPQGPAVNCCNCTKIANINYHDNEKYYCHNCYPKLRIYYAKSTPNHDKNQENYEDNKKKTGSLAQIVLNQYHIIVQNIFWMLLRESDIIYEERLRNCSRYIRVNWFIYGTIIYRWNEEKQMIIKYYEEVYSSNSIPTQQRLAEKLGFTEIRCEKCEYFRGTIKWENMHYYSHTERRWGFPPIVCGYTKETAKFRIYTIEQRCEIDEIERERQKERQRKGKAKIKCLCWRKGIGECPKHNHEIIWRENECLNCIRKNEKQSENNYHDNRFENQEDNYHDNNIESQGSNYHDKNHEEKEIKEQENNYHDKNIENEEKPIIRNAYSWDDEVIGYGKTSMKWHLITNTNIATNNYILNNIMIQENQQLKEYYNRQSEMIKDLGITIQELKNERDQYKKLFDEWWEVNKCQPMEIDEINNNEDAVRIDEILKMDEIQLNDEMQLDN